MQISAALQDFVSIFGGYTVLETEAEYTRSVEGAESDSEILLGGKIDCILQNPNNSQTFVVDYKSGKTPENLYYDEEKNTLCDFQMPMYYYICDDKFKIDNAAFFSLAWNSSTQEKGAKERFVPVFGDDSRAILKNLKPKCDESKIKTTKDFQLEVGKMLECAKIFDERIENQNFSIDGDNSQSEQFTIEPKFTTCAGCDYKSICRRTFIVSKH